MNKVADLLPSVKLQPHQAALVADATAARQQGKPFRRLLMWGTGSGKSLGAIAAAEALGTPYTAVVPAALRPTFTGERQRFTDLTTPAEVTSYQGAATGKATPFDTVLADESQRLGSPASSQAAAVRDLAAGARNAILMSATPVRNRPEELAPLLSILTNTPVTHDDFRRRYVGTERVRPGGLLGWLKGEPAVEQEVLRHTDELKNLLAGKVDYYAPDTPPVGVTEETHETELEPHQTELYRGLWGQIPFMLRWKLKNRYELTPQEMVRARSFLTGPRQVALSDLPYRPDADPLKAFHGSGKLRKAYSLMEKELGSDPRTKGIVYSNFPRAGLEPYAARLADAGVPHAVFHGGLSDQQRKDLVDGFNANRIRVALVGPAGAEGISLKGAQLIQILDDHWNQARTVQAKARGIRYDSHRDLPPELQRVKVQKFVAKLPLGFKDRLLASAGFDREGHRATVDDYLSALSARKETLNVKLMDLLKEVSAESRNQRTFETRKQAGEVYGVPSVPDPDEVKLRKLRAVVIRGNPAAAKFYADVGGPLSGLGYDVDYDPGEPYTEPPPADLWVGHSRGADRLRFAPPTTRTVAVGSNLPGAINHPDDDVDASFHRTGGAPPATHYELTPEMRERLTAVVRNKAANEVLTRLLEAKRLSDTNTRAGYDGKAVILRGVIAADPAAWKVDSHQPYTVGLTHAPSGFKVHLPRHVISDLLPEAKSWPAARPEISSSPSSAAS